MKVGRSHTKTSGVARSGSPSPLEDVDEPPGSVRSEFADFPY